MDSEDEACVEWGYAVLRRLELCSWSIKWAARHYVEGVVLFKSKEIFIRWPAGKPSYPLIAHEIAHVVAGKGGHDSEFAHQYMYLVEDFFEPKEIGDGKAQEREGTGGPQGQEAGSA